MSFANAYEIPFSLSAGSSLDLPGGGYEFIYLAEVSSGSSLRLSGERVNLKLIVGRRVEFGSPVNGVLSIKNVGSGVASGVLFVGSGNIIDSTVVGTVSVTNADKGRTESGVAFLYGRGTSNVASNYGFVYLANPAGSGVKLVVNQVKVSQPSGTGGNVQLFSSEDYAALELESGWTHVDSEAGKSKDIGGAGASGLVRRGRSTASSYTNHEALEVVDIATPGTFVFSFTEPFLVGEGEALGVKGQAVNELVRGNFEWFEEL